MRTWEGEQEERTYASASKSLNRICALAEPSFRRVVQISVCTGSNRANSYFNPKRVTRMLVEYRLIRSASIGISYVIPSELLFFPTVVKHFANLLLPVPNCAFVVALMPRHILTNRVTQETTHHSANFLIRFFRASALPKAPPISVPTSLGVPERCSRSE